MTRRLRLGMVGGGEGAFIGAVHRFAARLDDDYELVAAAPSSNAERARSSGEQLRVAPDRVYTDYRDMARVESQRDDGIDVVAIVVPNHLHFDVARAFLEAGTHVICDKPLTTTLADGERLLELATQQRCLFGLTHNYSGYPLVRAAREMVASGALGDLRVVQVEYAQDWLAQPLESRRQQAGRVAHRPGARRAGGLPRRHRLACGAPGRVRQRPDADRDQCRAGHLCGRPSRRRPRAGAAAL